jgi:hypothetical protein
MTSASSTTGAVCFAIDVAKTAHQVLVETVDGRRRAMRMANTVPDRQSGWMPTISRSRRSTHFRG